MTPGKVILSALAGIGIGTAIGILLAPDKGSTTRKRIAKKSNDYAVQVGEKINGIIDSITQKFETAVDDVTQMAENGKTKLEKSAAELAHTANSQKH